MFPDPCVFKKRHFKRRMFTSDLLDHLGGLGVEAVLLQTDVAEVTNYAVDEAANCVESSWMTGPLDILNDHTTDEMVHDVLRASVSVMTERKRAVTAKNLPIETTLFVRALS